MRAQLSLSLRGSDAAEGGHPPTYQAMDQSKMAFPQRPQILKPTAT